MRTYCTHPDCSEPINTFPKRKTDQQEYCHCCGMPQILAGRYIPQKELGKGGFGAAYLAIDCYTPKKRQCVVKQFRPSNCLDAQKLRIAEKLFAREAEVLETLGNEHPQIPDLYAFFTMIFSEGKGEEKQFFYIVQEFVDGENLEQELNRKGQLTETEVREVLENLLKILQFVHSNKSIHRDIKPSNIMRDRAGKLYLLDFGAVKLVKGASTTQRSTGIYSPGYAPPEQMYGERVYPSTDLYALAATCLRLLTGKEIQELYKPYEGKWVWRGEVDQISEKLAAILDRMLLPVPKDRFQSAQAILRVLEEKTILGEEVEELETSDAVGFSQLADWRKMLTVNRQPLPAPTPPKSLKPPLEKKEHGSSNSPHPPQSIKVLEPPNSQNNGEGNLDTPPPEGKGMTPSPSPTPIHLRSHFTFWECLAGAAFTGFEGALLLIALTSIFGGVSGMSMGLWGMSLGGLLYAQWKRSIEKIGLLIVGGITLVVVLLIPPIHEITVVMIILFAVIISLGAIAFTALLKLIDQLLSRV